MSEAQAETQSETFSEVKQLLCGEFAVSDVDYEKAVNYQTKYNGRIENILINMGALSEEKLPYFHQPTALF